MMNPILGKFLAAQAQGMQQPKPTPIGQALSGGAPVQNPFMASLRNALAQRQQVNPGAQFRFTGKGGKKRPAQTPVIEPMRHQGGPPNNLY